MVVALSGTNCSNQMTLQDWELYFTVSFHFFILISIQNNPMETWLGRPKKSGKPFPSIFLCPHIVPPSICL